MKKKVLLIEDDSSLILLVKFRFEEAGFQVFTASDGQEGLEIVKNENPDLIISDIMMPVMDGIEFVESTRNRLSINTPVILLSNAGQEEMVMKAFHSGADDFLSKPFSVNELLLRAKKYINN